MQWLRVGFETCYVQPPVRCGDSRHSLDHNKPPNGCGGSSTQSQLLSPCSSRRYNRRRYHYPHPCLCLGLKLRVSRRGHVVGRGVGVGVPVGTVHQRNRQRPEGRDGPSIHLTQAVGEAAVVGAQARHNFHRHLHHPGRLCGASVTEVTAVQFS